MIIKNRTTGKTIAKNLTIADSLLQNAKGLIGSSPKAMLFKTRFGIHTLFMGYPIDVIILDKKMQIVKIKENLKPNKFFFWNIKYNLVLELPQGTIKKTKTKPGNKLIFSK